MIKTHFKLMYGWLIIIPLLFAMYVTGQAILSSASATAFDSTTFAFDVELSLARVLTFFITVQAAFLFAPDYDASLELVLSYPQAAQHIFFKRFLLSFLVLIGSALLMMFNPNIPLTGSVSEFFAYWFISALALAGLIALIVQISKQGNFGLLVALGLWVGMFLGGRYLMEQFEWFVYFNPFLLPNEPVFLWNRLIVLSLGVGSLIWCWSLLQNTERLLQSKTTA